MSSDRHHLRSIAAGLVLVCAGLVGLSVGAQAPMFYPDDPIREDHDTMFDAGAAEPIPPSQYYDFIENTFLTPGDDQPILAVNTNTVDEVPNSTWFTGRMGLQAMSLDELGRGANEFEALSVDGWPVVEGKGTGRTPGWRVAAPDGTIYQIEFDPRAYPERTSGAEIIGSRFYHAIGFNTAESYLVDVDPEQVFVIPDATVEAQGRRVPFTGLDINDVLERSARRPDGKYRAVASRFIDGRNLGPFRYYGTRADDPNDLFPHEHRRELRANRVFAAWLNHVDSRGINSLDALVGPGGAQYVRHYMFDFGSIIGGGPGLANEPRAGNEYILDWGKGFKTLASLGLYVRPWLSVRYPDVPVSVGRFEAESFDPESWRPEYPNPAFRNLRLDDAYWGARIVSRFSDDAIRRVVEQAHYSDHVATDYITDTLIARRDKMAAFWLNEVNPVESFRLTARGRLTFENSAVLRGAATPPANYVLAWHAADNVTGDHQPVGAEVWVTSPVSQLPEELSGADFVAVVVRGIHRDHPGWLRSTRVHFRRTVEGWDTVGVQRAFDQRLPVSRPRAPQDPDVEPLEQPDR
jgi:hypothetical protein